VIEGAVATPVAVIWTTNAELNWGPVKEAEPATPPEEVGAKLAVKVALLPGFRLTGSATPPIKKPAPEAVAWEMVTELVPELVIVKLWLLVLPSDTLPKVTAEGLALSAVEGTELGVAELELIAAEVEFPLALVTPVQPDRMTDNAKRVEDRKTIRPRWLRLAFGLAERKRWCEFLEGLDITPRV
jgi:hypothetical protein